MDSNYNLYILIKTTSCRKNTLNMYRLAFKCQCICVEFKMLNMLVYFFCHRSVIDITISIHSSDRFGLLTGIWIYYIKNHITNNFIMTLFSQSYIYIDSTFFTHREYEFIFYHLFFVWFIVVYESNKIMKNAWQVFSL